MNQTAFESGVLVACAQNKVAPRDAIRLFEKHAALQEDEALNKEILKIGAAIMREGGYEEDARMFELMQSTPMITKYARAVYIDPVLEVLGAEAYAEGELEKQSSGMLNSVTSALGLTSGVSRLAALAALGVGITGGGAYWAMNRDANTSDEETTAKLEQAKYYRSLAKELRRRMRDQGVQKTKTPELVNKPTENLLPANDTLYA